MGSSRTHDGDVARPGALAHGDGQIDVEDIDRVLRDSVGLCADTADDIAALREWREDLSVARATLAYARDILAADVALLHHCLTVRSARRSSSHNLDDLIVELPSLLTSATPFRSDGGVTGPEPAESDRPGHGVVDIAAIVARSDHLISAHRDMAGTDLSSADALAHTLGELETELTTLAERQGAVATRLQEMRAVVLRQYAERSGPDGSSLDTPA